jgi:hypothetical protein
MGQRLKLVCGSLVGAVAIHAALVACGSSGAAGGAGSDAGGGGIFDALVDALTGRDALADTDGGSAGGGGSCSCGGPTMVASEDAAQWASGAVYDNGAAPTVLAKGPLMVRHVMIAAPYQPGLTSMVFIAKDGQCSPGTWASKDFAGVVWATDPDRFPIQIGQGNADLSFPVPAGGALCLGPSVGTSSQPQGGSLAAVAWSGFRPY